MHVLGLRVWRVSRTPGGLCNVVKPSCIFTKNLPLGAFREIGPFEKLGNVSSEFAGLALMREVGRVHDKVLAHLTDDRVEDLLVGLASDVDVAALEILAWQLAQWKVSAFTVDVKFLIHTVHHVRNPTGASFKKAHSQFGIKIEDTVQDHTG